jgi:hypothetical protein
MKVQLAHHHSNKYLLAASFYFPTLIATVQCQFGDYDVAKILNDENNAGTQSSQMSKRNPGSIEY